VGVFPFATVEDDSAHALPGFLRSVGRQVTVSAPEIDDAVAFGDIVGRGEDVYVSVDVDVLDAAEMSSTGYPATVGLSMRRLLRLIDLALADNRLIGFDVVEFAADREDRSPKTLADAQRAALVFVHLLGWVSRQANARTDL
jgi:arginase family enzyme